MYSRYKAFIFLTAFIFAVFGATVWFQNRSANIPETPGPEAQPAGAAADLAEAPPAQLVSASMAESAPDPALQTSEIPANWREDLGVPILCYHQIVTEEQYRERPTPYAVTVKQFREQMQWLADKNFYAILPDELLLYVRGQKKLDFTNGRRPIMITFDDGNNDFVNHAQKILDQHGFKSVLYIYPTYIMARKERSLTWAQIQAVRKAGHAIESHTMWHPMLSTMTDAEQRAQFADSKRILNEKSGADVKHLAYPFGIYTSSSLRLLRELGYQTAGTTFHGANQVGEDPYLLRRFLIVKGDGEKQFAQKTFARSLPLRYLNSEPGQVIENQTAVKFKIPAGLEKSNFKVRVFSTAQDFSYDKETGTLSVQVAPSKKRLSVLEILYKEGSVEYRANALFNHKRASLASAVVAKEKPAKGKAKKKKRKKKRKAAEE
ncbi:polysaccharide deacetylase family protein [Turneriella parva]|uniref:Polysaccharide deacetylase n=1 Tax=Turneriella parva (strain ATCC BAA-1111 / DSM 21527 / NCTC 11395 / H) TaxID=869212 RepID=I4B4B8_TURPD|nr:polysaccharide deacetylase family protein [Turneriella parva]AFM12125.1 polysaccharide deacetylase [Turneriella parva DSM 21527]